VVAEPAHEIKTATSSEDAGISPQISFGLGDAPVIVKKDLSFWILLALAFNICNCWASVAGTFALASTYSHSHSTIVGKYD
jgi:hypothetical protein